MTPLSTPAGRRGPAARSGVPLPPAAMVGFAIAVIAVALIALFSVRSMQERASTADRVSRTFTVIEQMQMLLSGLKDAETGERGFLLTGAEAYLDPYTNAKAALPGDFKRVRELTADNPQQRARLDTLEQLASARMEQLEQVIAMRRSGDVAGAQAIVATQRGRNSMEGVRALAANMIDDERRTLAQRQADWRDAVELSSRVQSGGSLVLLLLIAIAALLASRDHRARRIETWLRAVQAGLNLEIQGEKRLDVLGEHVLAYLADCLDAQVGALYLAEGGGSFRRVAGFAAPAGPDVLRPGEGLLGQVAKDNRALHVRDIPPGYLPVNSALGRGPARELLLAPASIDGVVHAVIELGLLRRAEPADMELLVRVSELLGIAVRSSKDRTRLEQLLGETQRQAEELQAQQEELRVSNEELEEQGSALKESQARLESQQTDLEQTNAQLEAQTGLLQTQRDALAQSQTVLAAKAGQLERSNQYKSEFLANMSHELRTPLNSTLILAKLLADNSGGNLSDEQVKFARTISSAGNDLLALINDILDLSKIEAGKIDVDAAPASRSTARTASRSCSWSRTRILLWKFLTTVTCWRRGGLFLRTSLRRCDRTHRSRARISAGEVEAYLHERWKFSRCENSARQSGRNE